MKMIINTLLVFDSSVLAEMGKRVRWCRLRRPRLRPFCPRPGWVRDQGQASRIKGPNGPGASASCLLRGKWGALDCLLGRGGAIGQRVERGFAPALFALKQEWNGAAQAALTHAETLVKNTSKVHDPKEGDPDRCCRLVWALSSVFDKCRHDSTSSGWRESMFASRSVWLMILIFWFVPAARHERDIRSNGSHWKIWPSGEFQWPHDLCKSLTQSACEWPFDWLKI